jgi:acetylornithine deacetylase/succinyl-diaminopimelate desuccinylase-like protein
MARLGWALSRLDRRRLPVHVVPPVRLMIDAISAALPLAQGAVLRCLATPALTDRVLGLAGPQVARNFDPLLHHTVSPVIVRGGVKPGVIPSEVELVLDGRVLPGGHVDDLVAELGHLLGRDIEIRVDLFDPYPDHLDQGLFETLGAALRRQDPKAIPVPYVSMATTDARFFARLGIQTYGFTPMQLPNGYAAEPDLPEIRGGSRRFTPHVPAFETAPNRRRAGRLRGRGSLDHQAATSVELG